MPNVLGVQTRSNTHLWRGMVWRTRIYRAIIRCAFTEQEVLCLIYREKNMQMIADIDIRILENRYREGNKVRQSPESIDDVPVLSFALIRSKFKVYIDSSWLCIISPLQNY